MSSSKRTPRLFGVVGATSKNLLVHAIGQRHLRRSLATYCRGRLVDLGCGAKPLSELIAPFADEHVGVDHADTQARTDQIDIFASLYSVPEADGSFDTALCTAVLEHLEEPELALRECLRLLRPGGCAIYTVPFIWHLHEEPRDFYRFTKYSLRYLFEKVGFEILELQPMSGFWVTFGQSLVYNLHRFRRGPLRWSGIIDVLGLGIQGIAYGLDWLDRKERWTWAYHLVARKPVVVAGQGQFPAVHATAAVSNTTA